MVENSPQGCCPSDGCVNLGWIGGRLHLSWLRHLKEYKHLKIFVRVRNAASAHDVLLRSIGDAQDSDEPQASSTSRMVKIWGTLMKSCQSTY